MTEEKFILYVQTTDDPMRQYSPLVLAQTARMMDIPAKVYFLGQALNVLAEGEAEKIQMGEFPSVAEMMDKALELGVEMLVCDASRQMLPDKDVKLRSGLKIVGAGTLNDLALDAGATMWF